MSFVTVTPDLLSQATRQLENIGSVLNAAHAAAAAATTTVPPPGADVVSEEIASLMRTGAQDYQALRVGAAAYENQFISSMRAGEGSYVGSEVANLQTLAAQDAQSIQAVGQDFYRRIPPRFRPPRWRRPPPFKRGPFGI